MNIAVLISVGSSLLLTGFNAAIFAVIKFNDLHHQGLQLTRIEKTIGEMDKKLDSHGERIACLEGKDKARKRK